jgi:eukaryotic-like serine/threonine-protein kinase
VTDIAPVAPNDIIAGKYRVDRVLGAGGMGVVVAATHLELGQPVALKFLLEALADREELVARFLREARNCVSINSEHVVRVMDVGRLESGAPYMVMEYLQGQDLESELGQRRTLPVQEAANIALQTCMGLAEAHQRNLVHRDLKPANLFMTTRSDGERVIKILDFGISKSLDSNASDSNLTRTNQSMGTPYYMSPEQIRAAPDIDVRTDIWSLGAILYELLAGTPPFRAESASAVCAQVLEASPQPLERLRQDVPSELWSVVTWCLRKRREERPQSVADLARVLEPHAGPGAKLIADRVSRVLGVQTGGGFAHGHGHLAPVAPPAVTDTSFSRTGEPAPRAQISTPLLLAVGVAGVLVSGVGATLYFGGEEEGSAPLSASAAAQQPSAPSRSAPALPAATPASAATVAASTSASAALQTPPAAEAEEPLAPTADRTSDGVVQTSRKEAPATKSPTKAPATPRKQRTKVRASPRPPPARVPAAEPPPAPVRPPRPSSPDPLDGL